MLVGTRGPRPTARRSASRGSGAIRPRARRSAPWGSSSRSSWEPRSWGTRSGCARSPAITPASTTTIPSGLSPDEPEPDDQQLFLQILDARGARARFEQSALVRRLWPPGLRERSLALFAMQDAVNRTGANPTQGLERLEQLRPALVGSTLRALPLWLMDTNEDEVRLAERAAARGVKDPSSTIFGACPPSPIAIGSGPALTWTWQRWQRARREPSAGPGDGPCARWRP